IIADVLGCPVIKPSVPDIACVGAAIIAGAGSGVYDSVREGCEKFLQRGETVYPDVGKTGMYGAAYRIYKHNSEMIAGFRVK
ncbi:MAG: hypothetical protein J5563_07795, partial [Clostridia bacterium]|nr:hypothetical protein [Clostridia bacterium]